MAIAALTTTVAVASVCASAPALADGLPPTISVDLPLLAGAVGDATNPALTLTLSDPDTDPSQLTISVAVANPAVVPASAIDVTGDGAQRTARFAPVGRGLTAVTFTVTDPDGNTGSTSMQYAASTGMPDLVTGRYHHHASDLSSAIDVGDDHILAVDDERNVLYLYDARRSGPPVRQIALTPQQLGTAEEVDFESLARIGDTLLAFGSHGNSRNGPARPERRLAVALEITGSGADIALTVTGRYGGLWSELRAWDQTNGHGLGANALGFLTGTQPGVLPNAPAGFNIEGFELAPDGTTGYLGFRAPTVQVGGRYHALIVPVLDVLSLFDGLPGSGPATFGPPTLLDLDGRSIRDLRRNDHGDYLIAAGASPQNPTWALYTWDGHPDHPPRFNRSLPGETGGWTGTWESIVSVPHPLVEGAAVRLIADDGHGSFYGLGENKDLPEPLRKSYAQTFALGPVEDDPDPGHGEQTITVVVPEGSGPGELIWTIDGEPHVTMTDAAAAGTHLRSTGQITPIRVTDSRAGGPSWSLSGQVSAFTGGLSGRFLGWTPKILADGAGAVAGSAVEPGIVAGDGLQRSSTLASAAAGHAGGTGTLGADLDLRIPVDTPPGTYTATLTITALS